MQKTVAIDSCLHRSIKIAAANKDLSVKAYLQHLYDSQLRLSTTLLELSKMEKGDVYRLELQNRLVVLNCENSLAIEQVDLE